VSLHDASIVVHRQTGRTKPDGRGNTVPVVEDLPLDRCNVQPIDTTETEAGPVQLRLRIATAPGDPHDEISPADAVTIPGRAGSFEVYGDVMTYQHIRPHTEFYVRRTRR
jgi:hypothetical protein